MMWNLGLLFGGGLSGTDVHVAVDLAAVGIDYLATKSPGQAHGQAGLAHGCGANYEEDGFGFGRQCTWNPPMGRAASTLGLNIPWD